MALCKLWTAKVASEAPLLSLMISHSLRTFGHDRLKPVQSEAVRALLQGQDVHIRTRSCSLRKFANLPGATCVPSAHLEEAEESGCVGSGRLNDR